MLSPKRTKFRKSMKGRMTGRAKGGDKVDFGDFGLQATECGRLTSRQIEAARIAISRHVKRGGKLYVRAFPHKPISRKPAETRMGHGKGGVDHWAFTVKPGHMLYEMEGVTPDIAQEAFRLASHKLPIDCKFVRRGVV